MSFLTGPTGPRQVFSCKLGSTDRGLLDEADGFVRLEADRTGRLVEATIVAPSAGEMISELTVAIQHRLTLQDLGKIIHPYPSLSDAVGSCCFQARMKGWPDYQERRRLPASWLVLGLALGAAAWRSWR